MMETHAGAMTEYRPGRTECAIQILHNSDARQEPGNNKYSRGKTVKAGWCVLGSEKETCDALLACDEPTIGTGAACGSRDSSVSWVLLWLLTARKSNQPRRGCERRGSQVHPGLSTPCPRVHSSICRPQGLLVCYPISHAGPRGNRVASILVSVLGSAWSFVSIGTRGGPIKLTAIQTDDAIIIIIGIGRTRESD
ncbi:hypothetical protein VTN02DRAFT_856 [Thermoascus thermophilus]